MDSKYRFLALMGWLAVTFAAALFGSRFMPDEWYAQLAKPRWTPPGFLFAPVWTILYAMIAVAAWLVWKQSGFSGATPALALFIFQLILNALWTWLFFGLHRPGLAFGDIALLWLAIVATLVAFWQHRPLAGALLIPYLAWVSFALALNFRIWRLNV